jgi:hypothetical protein
VKKVCAALALTLTVSPVFADANRPGRFGHMYDTSNKTEVMQNDPVETGRMNYAKAVCHRATGTPAGMESDAYMACLTSHGFVFVPNSPEEIQAQADAFNALRARQTLNAIGQGLIDLGSHDWRRPCQPHVLSDCR